MSDNNYSDHNQGIMYYPSIYVYRYWGSQKYEYIFSAASVKNCILLTQHSKCQILTNQLFVQLFHITPFYPCHKLYHKKNSFNVTLNIFLGHAAVVTKTFPASFLVIRAFLLSTQNTG